MILSVSHGFSRVLMLVLLFVCGSAAVFPPAFCADAKEKKERNEVIGKVVEVGGDGESVVVDHIESSANKEEKRTLKLTKDAKIKYVGFKGMGLSVDKPAKGFGIKASTAPDGVVITSVTFSPNLPARQLIPDKEKLTTEQLFKIVDENKDGKADFAEVAKWIIQSERHMPSNWLGWDKDGDDALNLEEFSQFMNWLPWYRLSRKTADEWVKTMAKGKSGELSKEELKELMKDNHQDADKVFEKLDVDKSGGISAKELQPYLDDQIHGKRSAR